MLAPTSSRAQDCSRNMLVLAGSGSYVAVPDAPSLHLTSGFTIECWAKQTSFTRYAALVDKGNTAASFFGLFFDTGSAIYGSVRNTTNIHLYSPPINSIANWHHYAFVFRPNDSLYLYIDTMEVASAKTTIGVLDSSTDSLRIGASALGVSFTGSIDELRIWNVPRPIASIKSTLYKTLSGNDSGLVLYYSFDDETLAPRVHDFSGHGHDGYIRGNAEIVPSTSPMIDSSSGFRLAAKELRVDIPTKRCAPSFDTVVHLHNLGTQPLVVNSTGFYRGQAFSIITSFPLTLPADSSQYTALRIHFSPPSGGIYTDTLYISSADDCGGILRIGIQASYDSVGLTMTPDTIRFGSLTQCELPVTSTIIVQNTSATDSITIVALELPPSSGITILTPLPLTLLPSQKTFLQLQLMKGTRGPVDATVALDLDKCSRQALLQITALRQQAELALPPTIDFGTVLAKLGGIGFDSTIVLRNSGDVMMAVYSVTASPTSLLHVTDSRQGTYVAPGDTLQLHIHLQTNSCGHLSGLLRVEGLQCLTDTSSVVSIDVTPPLPLQTNALDVGVTCTYADDTIIVSNPNDITVRLDTISFSKQSILFTPNAPSPFPQTIAPHDSIRVPIRFSPGYNGDYDLTAFLQMSPCGLGSFEVKGTMGINGLQFDMPKLSFGRGCDTTVITKSITLTNTSSRAVTISDTIYSGSSRFHVVPIALPFIIQPGSRQNFTIQYKPSLGYKDTASFTLLSNSVSGFASCLAASLRISGSREIANATWGTPTVEFDTICPGTAKDLTVGLHNIGIDSIGVLSATVTGNGFSLDSIPSTIGNDGRFVIHFAPLAEQEYNGLLRVTADSCGTSFAIPLHGSGGPLPLIAVADSIHDFGSILAGDSSEYCITLTNPSCTPITIRPDALTLSGTPFHLSAGMDSVKLAHGDSLSLCITFAPQTDAVSNAKLVINSDSAASRTIVLRGTGLAADVRLAEHLLDFGYVLHGDSVTLAVHDTNAGNYGATIATSNRATQDFFVSSKLTLSPGSSDSILVTFRPRQTTGLIYDTLYVTWNGHLDSVILRGQGTEKGMQLSAVGLNFGDVHVKHDSTRSVSIIALLDFPTITNIAISISSPFTETSIAVPDTIVSDKDTLWVLVTYSPRAEQRDTALLLVTDLTHTDTVQLTGRGVEAHVVVHPDSIAFGDVLLGDTAFYYPIRITNSGGFPLSVDSIQSSDSAFTVSPGMLLRTVQPFSEIVDTVLFHPVYPRIETSSLVFETSSPDPPATIIVSGTGVYPTSERPSFGYSVASDTLKAGDTLPIPVSIFGSNVENIYADSITLGIQYDPTMVRFNSVWSSATTAGSAHLTKWNDSTIEVTIVSPKLASGPVLYLGAEALLGAHPTSYIHVVTAEPPPSLAPQAGDGTFVVSDCGGGLHGVTFSGTYNVSAIVPNPAMGNATINYELGLDGPVTIDLYNPIGQIVKHLDLGLQKQGGHSASLDLFSLTAGRYVYRLKSLEYQAEGAVILLK